MKKIKATTLFLLLLLSGGFAFAQTGGGCYAGQVIAPPQPFDLGQPVPGAIVRVCSATATGSICSPLTPGGIFSDPGLLNPISNPFTADQNGNYNFCASQGSYLVQAFPDTATIYSFQVTVGIAPSGSYTFSGNNTFTGTNQFSGIELSNTLCTGALSGFSVLCATSAGPEVSINGGGFVFMPTIAGDIGGTSSSPTINSTHITGGTINTIPKFNASGNLVLSSCTDNASTVACTEPISSTGGLSGTTGTFSGNVLVAGTLGVTNEAAFGQTDSGGYIISAKDLAATTISTLHISHHATLSGAYGLEIHNYNSCGLDCSGTPPTPGVGATNAFVIHQYSQVIGGTAVQFDNTGPSTLLTLKNATNSVTSLGTIGTGNFIDFIGFSPGSPATPVSLGGINNNLVLRTDDSTVSWTFSDGVVANSGSAVPRAALTISSANTSFPGVSLNETATGIYGFLLNSTKNFAASLITTTDNGIALNVEKDGTGAGTAEEIINKGTGDSILVTNGTSTKWELSSAGKIATYNGLATSGNGVSAVVGTVDLTAQNASITTTNINSITLPAGQYRVTWYAKVTTPATTGAATSTLGPLTIGWTDADSVTLAITATATTAGGGTGTSSTGNSTTTVLLGIPVLLNVKASTNVTYAMTYASNTAAEMQYNLHIRLEAL